MEIETKSESGNKRLNSLVAVTVVVLSVFLAIQGIKAGNVAQGIDATKSDVLNKWAQYQAARLKHDIAEAALSTNLLVAAVPGIDAKIVAAERTKTESAITAYVQREKKYFDEAKALEADLKVLNRRDDQYDVAEALMSVGIAVSAIAILVESWFVLALGWVFGGFGMTMSVAAMRAIDLYPEWLVQIIA
jgi:hypothetical protein